MKDEDRARRKNWAEGARLCELAEEILREIRGVSRQLEDLGLVHGLLLDRLEGIEIVSGELRDRVK